MCASMGVAEEDSVAEGVFTAGCVVALGEAAEVGIPVCAPTVTAVHAAITIKRAQKPLKLPLHIVNLYALSRRPTPDAYIRTAATGT